MNRVPVVPERSISNAAEEDKSGKELRGMRNAVLSDYSMNVQGRKTGVSRPLVQPGVWVLGGCQVCPAVGIWLCCE